MFLYFILHTNIKNYLFIPKNNTKKILLNSIIEEKLDHHYILI